jgi:hypothetical protein
MAWRVLFYCLKVWFSALLIGTLVFAALTYLTAQTPPERDELKYILLLLANGAGFSLPSLLLSWIGSFLINRTSLSRKVKRLWISLLAVPLTLLPFILIDQGGSAFDWQSICLIAGLYYPVIVIAIFLWRLPEPRAAHS